MTYITLDQGKAHLRIDDDAEDTDLEDKIQEASDLVRNYLKSAADAYLGDDGAVVPNLVPYAVKAATKLMLGYLYLQRDGDQSREFEPGYLPRPVTALLYPLRDPALA
jgi:Phage QLRG family, putative DNA packaging.